MKIVSSLKNGRNRFRLILSIFLIFFCAAVAPVFSDSDVSDFAIPDSSVSNLPASSALPGASVSSSVSCEPDTSGASVSSDLSTAFEPVYGIPHLFYGRLSNGLDFYFLEDYSVPSASFCLAVKAGTSVQTSETTGLSELYARLFFSPVGGQQAFYNNGAFSVSAECTGDSAIYSAVFSADSMSDVLSLLAECVVSAGFPADEIAVQYVAVRTKADEWEASYESYINGSMDAKMFPAYPWSRETGLYPESLKNAGTDGVCAMLAEMRELYYVPGNSALFVSGSFAPDDVFAFAESLFSRWTESYVPFETVWENGGNSLQELLASGAAAPLTQELRSLRFRGKRSGGGRYVLVSDSFSKEFNQLIVQYVLGENFMTAAGAAAAETAASVLHNGSAFKKLVLSDERCGIKSADWLYTSFSRQQSGSRLIFQALMENGEVSPGTQALAFTRCVESDGVFPDDEVSYFAAITADRLSLVRKNPSQLLHALAEDWAFCNPVFPELNRAFGKEGLPAFSYGTEFARQFSVSYAEAARSLSDAELFHVFDSEPYVFLLLNTEIYNTNKKSLEKDGFELVPQNEGVWYKAAKDAKIAGGNGVLSGTSSSVGTGVLSGTSNSGDSSSSGNAQKPDVLQTSTQQTDVQKSFASLIAEKCAALLLPELEPPTCSEHSELASLVNSELPETVTLQPERVAQQPELSEQTARLVNSGLSGGIDEYISYGKTATELQVLSNGIPVLTQNGTTSSFSFQIQFSGKKEGFSSFERDIRTVLTDVISNNIRQYVLYSGAVPYSGFSVSSDCTLYGTSITIETTTEYAKPVIALAAEALFCGEISAPRVDESAYTLSSQWSMKRTDGDFQLYSAAMAYLYGKTKGSGYFDISGDFFSDVIFQDIELEYLTMLDASCISLSICGENAASYIPLAEDCFGFLMSFSSSCRDSTVSVPRTALPDETVSVTFRRIFTSSVKPGEYVEQPGKLIPTEVFYDPLHIYFECPAYDTPEYAVFVALVYELEEILDGLWDGGVLSSVDKLYVPVAGIWFHGVTKAAEVYATFAKGIERLNEPFVEARLKKIRNRYVEKFCSAQDSASTSTARLLESRFYGGDGTTYFDQLKWLDEASAEDFAKVAASFRTLSLLRSVSADTK